MPQDGTRVKFLKRFKSRNWKVYILVVNCQKAIIFEGGAMRFHMIWILGTCLVFLNAHYLQTIWVERSGLVEH